MFSTATSAATRPLQLVTERWFRFLPTSAMIWVDEGRDSRVSLKSRPSLSPRRTPVHLKSMGTWDRIVICLYFFQISVYFLKSCLAMVVACKLNQCKFVDCTIRASHRTLLAGWSCSPFFPRYLAELRYSPHWSKTTLRRLPALTCSSSIANVKAMRTEAGKDKLVWIQTTNKVQNKCIM